MNLYQIVSIYLIAKKSYGKKVSCKGNMKRLVQYCTCQMCAVCHAWDLAII